jgi:hypothetical protein
MFGSSGCSHGISLYSHASTQKPGQISLNMFVPFGSQVGWIKQPFESSPAGQQISVSSLQSHSQTTGHNSPLLPGTGHPHLSVTQISSLAQRWSTNPSGLTLVGPSPHLISSSAHTWCSSLGSHVLLQVSSQYCHSFPVPGAAPSGSCLSKEVSRADTTEYVNTRDNAKSCGDIILLRCKSNCERPKEFLRAKRLISK